MEDPVAYENYKTIAARDAFQFVSQLIADLKWDHNGKIVLNNNFYFLTFL